jgi:DNA-binding NarL/FixJ family response regulator
MSGNPSIVWLLDDREIRRLAIESFLSHWASKAAIDIRPVDSIGLIPPVGAEGSRAQLCVLATGGTSLADPGLAALVRALIPILGGRPLALLSDLESDDEVSRAIESGAHGLVSTGMAASVAVAALEFMLSGGTYFKHSSLIELVGKKGGVGQSGGAETADARKSAHARLRLVSTQGNRPGLHGGGAEPRPNLTQRQREIVDMLKLGRSNKEIARILDISDATVKIFVRQVMKKYGAINRTQVALLASEAMSPMDVVGGRSDSANAFRPEP